MVSHTRSESADLLTGATKQPHQKKQRYNALAVFGPHVPLKRAPACGLLLTSISVLIALLRFDLIGRRLAIGTETDSDDLFGLPKPPEHIPGETFAPCQDEISYELARDKYFSTLSNATMPHPFPVDVFPLEYITRDQCEKLSTFGHASADVVESSPPARVVVHLEVYKDIPMLKRIIQRLAYNQYHYFVIHLTSDVPRDTIDELTEYASVRGSSPAPLCVIQGGFVRWPSGTDIRILFGSMQWLVNMSPHWDFFISLSGADFPILDGPRLNQELIATGPKSWNPVTAAREEYNHVRFENYGMVCQDNSSVYDVVRGREFWLQNLAPDIKARIAPPLSSGGIWHRNMVEFLVRDDRARAAAMYFRHHHVAGVEHYWPSLYSLQELQNMLVSRDSCIMHWMPIGRFIGPTKNSFLTMDTWDDIIKPAIDAGIPFIRKFDSVEEGNVLDRIVSYADAKFGRMPLLQEAN